jgi:hypothetical protein
VIVFPANTTVTKSGSAGYFHSTRDNLNWKYYKLRAEASMAKALRDILTDPERASVFLVSIAMSALAIALVATGVGILL